MPAIENNWQLFGYDLRQVEKSWRLAWQQCLWGDESPLKQQLEEVVKVYLAEKEVAYYRAGHKIDPDSSAAQKAECEAIMLPDSLVLSKTLDIPLAAESELVAVMALEVSANSPFPADDTGSGWRLLEKTESSLRVQLVIISLSAAMQELGDKYQCHDATTYEVWAMVDDCIVVLDGFGKAQRQQRYRKSLLSLATVAGYCLLVLILMSAVYAGGKYWELANARALYANVDSEAANAVSLRTQLASANTMLAVGNELITTYRSPHVELKRLSNALSDGAWIRNFQMSDGQIRVQGQAKNPLDEIQRLEQESAYATVSAPGGSSGSGLQQFSFVITFAAED